MTELAKKTVKQLRALAAGRKLKGWGKFNKAQLIELLDGCIALPAGPTDGGKVRTRHSFPTVVPCPRCGATDTVAYSTKGTRQYRKCVRAVCRKRFTVQSSGKILP